jgi:hypothetical protein
VVDESPLWHIDAVAVRGVHVINLLAQWGQLLDFRLHKHMCLFRRAIPSDHFAGKVQSLDRSRVQTEVQVYFAKCNRISLPGQRPQSLGDTVSVRR